MTFVKKMMGAALGALLLGLSLFASPAQAGYVVTLEQASNNVVANGSGAIDLAGLVFLGPVDSVPTFIFPSRSFINTGPAGFNSADIYGVATGPGNFGSGGQIFADSGSGDLVGVVGYVGTLAVPEGYVSGDPLSDTSTYLNQTFTSLGVTPGTYVWAWGTGLDQNFTLIIGAPEPASAPLLGAALVGLFLAGIIRRTRYFA
jgi:hypothetical protein